MQVVALKRGLYSLKSFTATLGTVKLKIKPQIPDSIGSRTSITSTLPAVPSLGGCDSSGDAQAAQNHCSSSATCLSNECGERVFNLWAARLFKAQLMHSRRFFLPLSGFIVTITISIIISFCLPATTGFSLCLKYPGFPPSPLPLPSVAFKHRHQTRKEDPSCGLPH